MNAVFVTSNRGKVSEALEIVESHDLDLRWEPMFLGEVEVGATYMENALLKACAAIQTLRCAVLAEDAGLEVDAIDGLPGPRSARFAGDHATDGENVTKLLGLLHGVESRTARYRSVAVLLDPGSRTWVGEGVWEGAIAARPVGELGFGYDPVFVPKGGSVTAAELAPTEKNRVSHRSQALRAVAAQLGSS